MIKDIVLILSLLITQEILSQKVFAVDYASRADVKVFVVDYESRADLLVCLLYTSPSPRDRGCSRMPSSA